ncbi:MAG: flagellar basal body P-ring protein FlgI [Phycisphaerales bacterium]
MSVETRNVRWKWVALGALAALVCAGFARATSLQELVRLKGQGKSELRGIGLVIGLPGTGDSGKDLVIARPMAKLLENEGLPVGSLDELGASKSAALVAVSCEIPSTGARLDDRFDVFVSALHNPKSLEGGRLLIVALRGPLPGQPVFAMASGPVVIEGLNTRSGRVRGGGVIVRDIPMPTISEDGSVTLLVEPAFAGWTTSQLISSTINQHRLSYDETARDIAYAIDERTVRVEIPDVERANPAGFLSDILGIRFDSSLVSLPARIIVNEREKAIVVSGDVEIRPTLIAHGSLVVTAVTPPLPPSAQNPLVERRSWTALDQAARPREKARLQDLLAAFKQLDVSVDDQIAILNMLRRNGDLHAEMIVD